MGPAAAGRSCSRSTRRKSRPFFAMAAALAIAACSTNPSAPPEVRDELAPTGKLRAGINYGNPVLARKDAASGGLRGVTVTLSRELGRRIGVPVELVGYDAPGKLVAGLKANEWDVAFLAYDPARAGQMAFAPPYMEVQVTYLVRATSDLGDISQVDRTGVRVAVGEKNAADLFLTRNLRRATVVRAPSLAAAFTLLKDGSAEAFAGNGQELFTLTQQNPGFRIIEGRFTTIPHAAAVPPRRAAAAAYVRAFLEDAKRSGLVQRAIDESGIRGVVVAPASP
jgi:polar amino acid transport system substrate-binding protein